MEAHIGDIDHLGSIGAWSIAVDPFDLGPRIEGYVTGKSRVREFRRQAEEDSSRLKRLPKEIIEIIAKYVHKPTHGCLEKWSRWEGCCRSTCSHALCTDYEEECEHEPCLQHRRNISNFKAQVVCQRTRENRSAYAWGLMLRHLERVFGVQVVYTSHVVANSDHTTHTTRYFAYISVTLWDYSRGLNGQWPGDAVHVATPKSLHPQFDEDYREEGYQGRFEKVMKSLGLAADTRYPGPLTVSPCSVTQDREICEEPRLRVFRSGDDDDKSEEDEHHEGDDESEDDEEEEQKEGKEDDDD